MSEQPDDLGDDGSDPLTDPLTDPLAGDAHARYDAAEARDRGQGTGNGPLFVGDAGQLPENVRATLVTLLKRRYISAETNRREWRLVLDHESALRTRLHDMFLDLVVDRDYEVAFKRQAVSEAGSKFPTLLYDQALNREETILLVVLRRLLRSGQQAGHDETFVDRAELLDELASYRRDDLTDHAREDKAVANAVDSFVKMDLLLPTAQDGRYRVPAVVEVLVTVQRLREIDRWLRAENGTGSTGDSAAGADDDRPAGAEQDDLFDVDVDPADLEYGATV